VIARRSSSFPSALAVVFGSFLLATVITSGAASRAAPAPSTAAVLLTVGDRTKAIELIHLLRELASYEPIAAARYVAQADAAHRRGDSPIVRIPMPSAEAAAAVALAAPRAGATATVEPTPTER